MAHPSTSLPIVSVYSEGVGTCPCSLDQPFHASWKQVHKEATAGGMAAATSCVCSIMVQACSKPSTGWHALKGQEASCWHSNSARKMAMPSKSQPGIMLAIMQNAWPASACLTEPDCRGSTWGSLVLYKLSNLISLPLLSPANTAADGATTQRPPTFPHTNKLRYRCCSFTANDLACCTYTLT